MGNLVLDEVTSGQKAAGDAKLPSELAYSNWKLILALLSSRAERFPACAIG